MNQLFMYIVRFVGLLVAVILLLEMKANNKHQDKIKSALNQISKQNENDFDKDYISDLERKIASMPIRKG